MNLEIARGAICTACNKRIAGFMQAARARCLWCFVRSLPLLRRSFLTAIVVGTILTAINQGTILADGDFPASLYWQIPLTYCVPFCVATWGAIINSRIRPA